MPENSFTLPSSALLGIFSPLDVAPLLGVSSFLPRVTSFLFTLPRWPTNSGSTVTDSLAGSVMEHRPLALFLFFSTTALISPPRPEISFFTGALPSLKLRGALPPHESGCVIVAEEEFEEPVDLGAASSSS
ncbi:hypothetical protein OPV22_010219 [Ensete ventricosum]|uniref:Uncharacterized protein n=1 Tax=Ensete ventricosum TaxID=4639 RepID=A0AAV8RKZ0_ENSVE|nr:hypothetical protein OPV22_010219 [Ensete ventricosum]